MRDFLAGTTPVNTGVQLARDLSLSDQLAIQVIVTDASGTDPTLTLAIEHSTDGCNWMARSSTPEIDAAPLSVTGTTVLFGYDAGSTARLAYTRLTITLGTSNPTAPAPRGQVRIWVTGRDRNRPKACACPDVRAGSYHHVIPNLGGEPHAAG